MRLAGEEQRRKQSCAQSTCRPTAQLQKPETDKTVRKDESRSTRVRNARTSQLVDLASELTTLVLLSISHDAPHAIRTPSQLCLYCV